MLRFWTSLALMCVLTLVYGASSDADSAVASTDEVIQWNKTLLTIVRSLFNLVESTLRSFDFFAVPPGPSSQSNHRFA